MKRRLIDITELNSTGWSIAPTGRTWPNLNLLLLTQLDSFYSQPLRIVAFFIQSTKKIGYHSRPSISCTPYIEPVTQSSNPNFLRFLHLFFLSYLCVTWSTITDCKQVSLVSLLGFSKGLPQCRFRQITCLHQT